MSAPAPRPSSRASRVPPTVRPRPERTRRIRRLVVTWTLVAFVAAWGGIFVQMRAGADPVLGARAGAGSATARTAAPSPATTSAPQDGASRSVTQPATSAPAAPSPVTTAQS